MRLDRSLNIFGPMLFLVCAAQSLECQTPPPATKANPAPAQAAENQQPKTTDSDLRSIAKDLVDDSNQVRSIADGDQLTFEQRQALKTALDKVQLDIQKLEDILTATQPPVKVRGGAMTIRTTNISHKGDSQTFDCVQLDPDLAAHPLELQFIKDPTEQGWIPTQRQTLNGNETIDLLGRNNGTILVPHGIRLQFTRSCKVSGVDQFGVTIKPLVLGSKSFYEYRDHVHDEDGTTYIKRFQHPGCQKLPKPDGDEDTCEQMSDIKINGSSTPWAHCLNGECFVQIVQQ